MSRAAEIVEKMATDIATAIESTLEAQKKEKDLQIEKSKPVMPYGKGSKIPSGSELDRLIVYPYIGPPESQTASISDSDIIENSEEEAIDEAITVFNSQTPP